VGAEREEVPAARYVGSATRWSWWGSPEVGKLVSTVYAVTPCAIVVPAESEIRRPEDLAGVEVGVSFHSGSHFTTLQGVEAALRKEDINLSFDGSPPTRLDSVLDRSIPAADRFRGCSSTSRRRSDFARRLTRAS
jgi:ABC-type amino acid transport substrate-binding protein